MWQSVFLSRSLENQSTYTNGRTFAGKAVPANASTSIGSGSRGWQKKKKKKIAGNSFQYMAIAPSVHGIPLKKAWHFCYFGMASEAFADNSPLANVRRINAS